MVEALNVGLFRVSADNSEFIYANPAAIHILGYNSFEELIDISMRDHYKNPKQTSELLEFLKKHGQCRNFEIPMRKKNGTIIWVSLNATVIYNDYNTHNPNSLKYHSSHLFQKSTFQDKERQIKWIDCIIVDITEQRETINKLRRLNRAYERFVPHEFLKILGKKTIEDVQLNDRIKKKMTILFSDIRLFSTLSETMTPEENFKFINSYLSHMGPFVRQNHGYIDKFIGDSIMAIFARKADDAVNAAIAMLNALKTYNEGRNRAGYRTIEIGIGINTGVLMMGTIGEANRMEGTVISDAVNAASRLEQLTKQYTTPLLISEHTYHALTNPLDFDIRFVDRVLVKGRAEPIAIYEVFNADPPERLVAKQNHKALFETAMYHLRYQDIDHARKLLLLLSEKTPDDPLVKRYQSVHENADEHLFSPWKERETLKLKDNLQCDLPIIDDDHVEMFRITEVLMRNIKVSENNEKIIEELIELNKKAAKHFQTEEEMMKQLGYPSLDIHRMLHKEFLANSEYILEMASKIDYTKKYEALHLLLRIETLFVEWIANHEITADKYFIASMMGFK